MGNRLPALPGAGEWRGLGPALGRVAVRAQDWRALEAIINRWLEQATETHTFQEKISILLRCWSAVEESSLPPCPLHLIVNREVGLAYYDVGDYPRALHFHDRELDVARALGDALAECEALGNAGACLCGLGRYAAARANHTRQLELAVEHGDAVLEAQAHSHLGAVHEAQGAFRAAMECYHRDLDLSKARGDPAGEARACTGLGNCWHSLGDFPRAVERHSEALAAWGRVPDRAGQASAAANLGNAYCAMGDHHQALEAHQRHLQTAILMRDRGGEGAAHGNLGVVYEAMRDYPRALECHRKHLEVCEELEDPPGTARACENLGNTYLSLGSHDLAKEHYQRSLDVARELGDEVAQCRAWEGLGLLADRLGHQEDAVRCLRRAWGLALRADDSRGPARIAAGLERALRRRGAWAAALLMADAGRRRAGRRPAEPPEDGAATGAGEAGQGGASMQPGLYLSNALEEGDEAEGDNLPEPWPALPLGRRMAENTAAVVYSLSGGGEEGEDDAWAYVWVADQVMGVALDRKVHTTDFSLPDDAELQEVLAEWHQLLVRPILTQLEHLTSLAALIIVPDERLQKVPFAALRDGGRCLGEQVALLATPSLHIHHAMQRQPAPQAPDPAVASGAKGRPTLLVVAAEPPAGMAGGGVHARDWAAALQHRPLPPVVYLTAEVAQQVCTGPELAPLHLAGCQCCVAEIPPGCPPDPELVPALLAAGCQQVVAGPASVCASVVAQYVSADDAPPAACTPTGGTACLSQLDAAEVLRRVVGEQVATQAELSGWAWCMAYGAQIAPTTV